MDLPEGFALAAIGERANPFDAFVSNQYARLEEMPKGAIVGTSSLRREAQLRARYPHLVIKPLRGNVQTRLSKLDNGECLPPDKAHWVSKLQRIAKICTKS